MLEYDRILCECVNGSEALRSLVAWKKAQSPQFSLTYIARKLGIKSKGYVSEILSGKESLHAKHWDIFALILGLDGIATDYLKNLLIQDQMTDPAEKEGQQARLEGLQKMMKARSRQDFLDLRDLMFAFEVFCAFSIFGNQPTRRYLIDFFGKERMVDVDRALSRLLTQGFIRKDGEVFTIVAEKDRFLHFFVGASHSHLDFLQAGFDEGRQGMQDWFENADLASFATFLVSVNEQHYRRILKGLKQDIKKSLVEMESADADMIIRFNLQIFPRYRR